MIRRSIQPIFKDNYHTYTKDEFLYDADFEFVKVKNLLNKSPKMLKDDPLLSIDYLKIINLIKKKKLMEKTSDQFDPTSAFDSHYMDTELNERLIAARKQRAMEYSMQNMDGIDNSQVSLGVENYD